MKIEDKSNEITAIPELLELLSLKGALVSIDAMGCQKEASQEIVDKGVDYLLAVKRNQKNLVSDIELLFEGIDSSTLQVDVEAEKVIDKEHGNVEARSILRLP